MVWTTTTRCLATLAGVALVIAGCGGSVAPPPATSEAAPSAVASVSPLASPSAPPSQPPPQAAASPSRQLGLSGILGSVTKLDSLTGYQISMSIEQAAGTTDVTATTVREPVDAARYDVSKPQGEKSSIIKIEEHGWLSNDGSTFVRTPLIALDSALNPFTPAAIGRAIQTQAALNSLMAVGTEEKNGVQAIHYHVDEATTRPPTAAGTIPPGASADVWVAEDGYLVGLVATGFGADLASMSVEVTRINDPSLEVEPPE
jgi:hypothetical protein